MTNTQLQSILGHNVVELDFVRRHPKTGWSNIRGLLGTTNPEILNSDFGFQVIHFKPPIGVGMGYDYKAYGLCVVFDMFRQEYRVFGAEQVNIHKQWPVTNEEEIQAFYDYFYGYIINMPEADKLKFMGFVGDRPLPTTGNPTVTPPKAPGFDAAKQRQATNTPPPAPQSSSVPTYIKKAYDYLMNKITSFFSGKRNKKN